MSEQEISGDQMGAADPVDNVHAESAPAAQQVPLDALQAERSERQRLQEELKMIKDNMSLMMARERDKQAMPHQEDPTNDDDVLTVGEFKKALAVRENAYRMSIEELRMTQKYPDYQEVVTKYLPEVLKENPNLRRTLEQTQDFEMAYYLAKNSDTYKSTNKKAKKNEEAQRIVENSQRAGSLSSVGRTSPISEAKRWKDMSDDEFRQYSNRHMA